MIDRPEKLESVIDTVFKEEPAQDEYDKKFFRAPGRVNLIGGHTDYNDGFVLPVAIDRAVFLAARRREDKRVRVYSCSYEEKACFELEKIVFSEEIPWVNYLQGVAYFMQQHGYELAGMDAVIKSDVPAGAGLSSSAALEVSTALAFTRLNQLDIDRVKLARICQQAENEFVGVECGIMDQLISALGQRGSAMFLDCRSGEFELLPAAGESFKIIVADTGVKHDLAGSAYNERRRQCNRGTDFFDGWLKKPVKALRDVSPSEFENHADKLPENIRKRCEHVIKENERVKKCRKALKSGNLARAGRLMKYSHESLRDLYEVSCAELDLMVELALKVSGTIGARMTGAGFGGSTVNLVKTEAVEIFKKEVGFGYKQETGLEPDIYVSDIVDGACEIIL